MVGVVTGSGLGLERTSLALLGGLGQLGQASNGQTGEGVYVNGMTGNLVISHIDETIVGIGPSNSISRTYNSLGDLSDTNHDNWRGSFERKIASVSGTVNTAGSSVQLVDWDGGVFTFEWDALTSKYVCDDFGNAGGDTSDHKLTLTNSGSTWTWNDPKSKITETFDAVNGGRIMKRSDLNGNSVTYNYDGTSGKLTSIKTSNGDATNLTWTGDNLTSIVTVLSNGTTSISDDTTTTSVHYGYDSSNRLVTVDVDLSPTDNSIADGDRYRTTYTYTGSTGDLVSSIRQDDGTYIAISYDTQNRVSQTAQTYTGTSGSSVIRTTTFAYDTPASQQVTITDDQNQKVVLSYTSGGRLKTITTPSVTSDGTTQTQTTTISTVTGTGRIASITDAEGNLTTYTYDDDTSVNGSNAQDLYDGNLLKKVDALGNTTEYTYDSNDQVLTATVHPNGSSSLKTTYAYDSNENLRFVVSPGGSVTEYRYDSKGQRTVAITYSGNAFTGTLGSDASTWAGTLSSWATGTNVDRTQSQRVNTAYDYRGNVLSVTSYGAIDSNGAGVSATASVTNYTYDQHGRLLSRQSATSSAQDHFIYDGLGRLTFSTGMDGITTSISFSEATSGHTTIVTLASGLVQTSTYNRMGVLVAYSETGSGVSDTSSSALDSLGRSLIDTDARGNSTYHLYDALSRKTADIAADGAMTEYQYDKDNRVIGTITYATRLTTPKMQTLVDGSGNPTNVPVSSVRPAATTSDQAGWTVYDADGRVLQTIDGLGYVTGLTYDGIGRLVQTIAYATAVSVSTYKATPPTTAVAPATNAADHYGWTVYDSDGNVIETIDSLGYCVLRQVDEAGRVQWVKAYTSALADTVLSAFKATSSAYPTAVVKPTDRTGGFTYSVWDDRDNLVETIDPLGFAVVNTYDKNDRVVSSTAYATAIDVSTLRYDLPPVSPVLPAASTGDQTTRSVYDDGGRLAYTIDATGSVAALSYDAADNVVQVSHYDNLYASGDQSLSTMNTWAAAAAQASDTANRITRDVYDAGGRLAFAIDEVGTVTGYAYDDAGNLSKTTLFDDAYSAAGPQSLTTMNTWSSARASDTDNQVTTFTYDAAGRLLSTVDAMTLSESYTYDAFGNRRTATNKLGGVTTFTYDACNQLTRTDEAITWTDAGGTARSTTVTTTYGYDAFGNRNQMIEAFGAAEQRTTNYTYDADDRLHSQTGDQVSLLSPTDLATTSNVTPTVTNTYDAFGNLTKVVDAAGAATFMYYDLNNRKIAAVDALNTLSKWSYDAFGNVQTATVYGVAVAPPADPPGSNPPTGSTTPGNSRATTFVYDSANRLISTSVTGVEVHSYTGSSFNNTSNLQTIKTQTSYNSFGEAITQIDANGNKIRYFYDVAGRRTYQLDETLQPTRWQYDKNGNVTEDKRYARTATLNDASHPELFASWSWSTDAADRRTVFDYDENGNRLHEGRAAVDATTVSNGGVLSTTSQYSDIYYTYNALGEVATKQEANGDTTTYGYDSAGRLLTVKGPAYSNSAAVSVQDLVTNSYDALGNLTKTVESDATGHEAATRTTTYTYSAGGRLGSVKDASGFVTNYAYDANGHVVRESYARIKSDLSAGNAVTEATAYQYDLLGRVTQQAKATLSGSTWSFGDKSQTRYDLYGEVTGKGVNGLWQETTDYDTAGRAWRTTSGDGIAKITLFDANGNATLIATSNGSDLSTKTVGDGTTNDLLGKLNASGYSNDPALKFVTVLNTYNARNQLTSATQTNRSWTVVAPTTQYGSSPTVTTASGNVVTGVTYNAFGEVATQTDSTGNVTTLTYNAMGRLKTKTGPSVSATDETGTDASAARTFSYFYDASGRLVATTDELGRTTKRLLLAGTGHGDDEAKVLKIFNADSSTTAQGFNVFADVVTATDGLGSVTTMKYDAMSRLTEEDHPSRALGAAGNNSGAVQQLKDTYSYDGLGQRVRHGSGGSGNGDIETTDYDSQGRVVKTVSFAGLQTDMTYTWKGSLATAGKTFGGWVQTTKTTATAGVAGSSGSSVGPTTTDQSDYFGRQLSHVDYGNHGFVYTYDVAGRMTSAAGSTSTTATGVSSAPTSTSQNLVYTYTADGRQSTVVDTQSTGTTTSSYTYDKLGRRATEKVSTLAGGITTWHKDAIASYDALGRMTQLHDWGEGTVKEVLINYKWDAVGNQRLVSATYAPIGGSQTTTNYWYKYDAMNRFTTTMGTLQYNSGTQKNEIVRGLTGTDITYDAAGQRKTAATWRQASYSPTMSPVVYYYAEHMEGYLYTADGYLANTYMSDALSNTASSNTYVSAPALNWSGPASVTVFYDAMGHVLQRMEYTVSGSTATLQYWHYGWIDANNVAHDISMDADGHVTSDTIETRQQNGSMRVSSNSYSYFSKGSGDDPAGQWTHGTYMGGQVTHVRMNVTTKVNGQQQGGTDTSDTATTYVWYDATQQNVATLVANVDAQSEAKTSTFAYDANGQASSVHVNDIVTKNGVDQNKTHDVTITTNAEGQISARNQTASLQTGNVAVAHYRYYFDGMVKGDFGNDAGDGSANTAVANFDTSFDAVDRSDPSAPYSYTVNDGDTLQSIAGAVWGDGSMWYLIAQANGLDGTETLVAGQVLVIPDKVTNIHNNASTWDVYDPTKAIGDTQPFQINQVVPTGQHKHGCGFAGQLLLVAIAVAVSVATYGTFAPESASLATSIGWGAVAGAAGSVASQAVGVATGLQDGFSWKGVAMSALAGGIGAGVGQVAGKLGLATKLTNFGAGAVKGIADSALTQGLEIATGLKHSFSWLDVATSGVGGGIGEGLHMMMPGAHASPLSAGGIFNAGASGMAGGIASAATSSLIAGTDFGDNVLAALPQVIGSTIGNLAAEGIAEHEAAAVQQTVNAAMAAPETAAEAQRLFAAITGDSAGSLQWGGTTISNTDAHQIMLDVLRMDRLASSSLGATSAFKRLYADFQSSLAAADSYNSTSNQLLLGSNLHRDQSAYSQGLITDSSSTGYQGYLYKVGDGSRYIFANAGSNDLSGQRFDQDTDYALGGVSQLPQIDIAISNARVLEANGVPNLSFTGHSLGGALAIAQGLALNAPVVTFNSAPFSPAMARAYQFDLSDVESHITDYRVINDPLSMAEDHHEFLAASAAIGAGGAMASPSVREIIDHLHNLTPPPGRHVALPAGASGFAAHSIVNVLNSMSGR